MSCFRRSRLENFIVVEGAFKAPNQQAWHQHLVSDSASLLVIGGQMCMYGHVTRQGSRKYHVAAIRCLDVTCYSNPGELIGCGGLCLSGGYQTRMSHLPKLYQASSTRMLHYELCFVCVSRYYPTRVNTYQ